MTPRKRTPVADTTTVVGAVTAQLEQIGKAGTPTGRAALVLAARLDAGADPGSAMAAMAKELRATMAELAKTATAMVDPVDELRRKREQRRSG